MTTLVALEAGMQVEHGHEPSRTAVRDAHPDADLIAALRAGDERVFASLVTHHQSALLGAATRFLRDATAAQDVVQDTWIGFLNSLPRFEGRCSIKTWLFRILFNKARTRAAREWRCVPFSSLLSDEMSEDGSAADAVCFRGSGACVASGHWTDASARQPDPCQVLDRHDAIAIARRAMDRLPKAQGTVMFLRDVQGQTAKEVCDALAITPANQRVLLHRARTKVRKAVTALYGEAGPPA
ncbi:MAG: RNA polymerase sigma24 factor [Gemmatimonadota bacterium]|nr:MAG: RNA polymerase sigma24 factor [Gemmatimonadota bacterium]